MITNSKFLYATFEAINTVTGIYFNPSRGICNSCTQATLLKDTQIEYSIW